MEHRREQVRHAFRTCVLSADRAANVPAIATSAGRATIRKLVAHELPDLLILADAELRPDSNGARHAQD